MDSSNLCLHHRHHHHHHHVLCPNHPHEQRRRFMPHCPVHCSLLNPNLHRYNYVPLPLPYSQLAVDSTFNSNALTRQDEYKEPGEEMDEEEEEEYDFVLTDEWREFFAKSEAKRRLAKKQAKKKKGKDKSSNTTSVPEI